jgi:hypothetical protein
MRGAQWGILAMMFLGLCGRALSFPLNRDENLFVTVSALGGLDNLYGELGYNHLPYLPWLIGTVYRVTGTEHYLLAGRALVLCGWAAMLLALLLIGWHRRAGWAVFFCSAALLMGNTLLLGQPGMLVSNNLLPVPAALFAMYFVFRGMDGDRASPARCFLAGLLVSLTVGLKANYIFLAPILAAATILAPAGRTVGTRLRRQSLPLAAGGLLGGLPVLCVMGAAPQAFFAHTIRYFTKIQPVYWADSPAPKVASPVQKLLLADGIWASGASLLSLAAIAALAALSVTRRGWRESMVLIRDWQVALTACLVVCGVLVTFLPTPSFVQYFVPPIPFLAVMLVLMRGTTHPAEAKTADGILIAVALLAVLTGAPRIAPGLFELTRPSRWHGVTLHHEMRSLVRAAGFAGGEAAVTITPVLALEGGLTVPPEFAAGQFVYRVADYLPARDRRYYTTTSPSGLAAFLEARAPPAIIISGEESLERPFARYARSHGYREFAVHRGRGGPRLFRRRDDR